MNTRIHSFLRSALARAVLAAGAAAATLGAAQAQQIDIPTWRAGTEYRAMKLQRELAGDMRQDQALLLGSHNSYNSSAYGLDNYASSQHSYSLSEQLDLGLRSLDLDVHAVVGSPNNLWLAHTTCFGAGVNAGHRTLRTGLSEIRTWLNNNPDEVVFLNIEQHFPMNYPSAQHTELANAVEETLGGANPGFGPDVLIRPSEIPLSASFGGIDTRRRAVTLMSLTLTDLRTRGRVLIANTGGATSPCDGNYWPDYPAQDFMLGDIPSFSWCFATNWGYINAKDFAGDGTMHYWGGNAVGARFRGCNSVTNASIYSTLYNNTSAGEYDEYGSEPPSVVREAVRAGMDYIRFDPVGKSLALPGNPIEFPADEQMRSTIWSWDWRYPPPVDGQPRAAMAVVQGDTAQIRWTSLNADMRYALQDQYGNWSISSSRGTFAQYPPEGSGAGNFRAPGNGFEMQNLFGEMIRAGITQVWINYNDSNGDGVWTHSTQNRTFGSSIPLPIASPVPSLVFNSSTLASTLFFWQTSTPPPTGRVLGVLPGSYPGAFVLSVPAAIVPAEYANPVAIGRP